MNESLFWVAILFGMVIGMAIAAGIGGLTAPPEISEPMHHIWELLPWI